MLKRWSKTIKSSLSLENFDRQSEVTHSLYPIEVINGATHEGRHPKTGYSNNYLITSFKNSPLGR